jgi:hypothetical protein
MLPGSGGFPRIKTGNRLLQRSAIPHSYVRASEAYGKTDAAAASRVEA